MVRACGEWLIQLLYGAANPISVAGLVLRVTSSLAILDAFIKSAIF